MAWCTECGAADQAERFCQNCGFARAPTSAETSESSSVQHQAPPPPDQGMGQAGPGRPPKRPARRRGWLIAGLAFVTVTAAGTPGGVLDFRSGIRACSGKPNAVFYVRDSASTRWSSPIPVKACKLPV